MKFLKRMAAFCAAAMLTGSAALAQEYDAQQAKSWMEQFAQALSQLAPVNDPAQTLDPARPGEYLQEYEFGTVQAATSGKPDGGADRGNRREHGTGDRCARHSRRHDAE